ncbi:MAG: hypothetical protein ACOYOU_15780 [Kiritimatiellia bacterium]
MRATNKSRNPSTPNAQRPTSNAQRNFVQLNLNPRCPARPPHAHGLFLKRHNLSNRQDAKVAKTNKIDVSACEETTTEKLGVLGVLAVKNAASAALQEKTMVLTPPSPSLSFPAGSPIMIS